jgi:hypothetical protein
MTKTTSKATTDTSAASSEIEHDDDLFEDNEYVALSDGIEKETIKRDARRKIEIYWEKKRLKEQFDDFDESEFGF